MLLAICYILAKCYRQNSALQARDGNFPFCHGDTMKMGIKWKPGHTISSYRTKVIFWYLLTQWLKHPVCNL